MVNYIKNFDTSYTDRFGNALIQSDRILDVYYYDSSEESWTKDYSLVADIPDPRIETTVSGNSGVWKDTSSTSVSGSYLATSNFAVLNEDLDYIIGSSWSTSSHYYHDGGELVKWPMNNSTTYTIYPWVINSNSGWVKFDLGGIKTLNLIHIEWASMSDGQSINRFPKEFYVEVSADGVSYTTVATGNTFYGQVAPFIVDTDDFQARYIRLQVTDNWGDARTQISRVGVFNRGEVTPTAFLYGCRFSGASATGYAAVSQDIDLTNVDALHMGVGGFRNGSSDYIRIYIGGVLKYDSPIYGGTTTHNFKSIKFDTTGNSGVTTVELRGHVSSLLDRRGMYAWLSTCSTKPSWFTETGVSNIRGPKAAFPEKAVIVSDSEGISIIDISTLDADGFILPSLWMRTKNGTTISSQIKEVYASSGKVYLSGDRGVYVLDFNNDWVDLYTSDAQYRKYGLAYLMEDEDENPSYFKVENDWETISTDSAHRLWNSNLRCSHGGNAGFGDYVVGGTEQGAFALVSGTIYNSKFKDTVSSIQVVDDSVVLFGIHGDSSSKLGVMWDISNVGIDDFEFDDVFHQNRDNVTESFNGGYDTDKWSLLTSSVLDVTTSGTYATISGSPQTLDRYNQRASIVLSDPFANRPFKVSVDVRLKQWPDICPGEFRFGIFNNELLSDSSQHIYNDRGLYLAARNDYSVPLYSDTFSDGSFYRDNIYTEWGGSNIIPPIEHPTEGATLLHCNKYNQCRPYHSNSSQTPQDVKVTFKVRIYELLATEICRVGFSNYNYDGAYTSTGKTDRLTFGVIRNSTYPSGVYAVEAYDTGVASIVTTPLLSGDGGADSSVYHDVELLYENSGTSLSGWIDGAFIGSVSIASWDKNPYFSMTVRESNSNNGRFTGFIKDLKFDYFDTAAEPSREYCICRKEGTERDSWGNAYTWGKSSNPYSIVSQKTTFSGTEGSASEPWRRWELFYDPTNNSLSGYIDNYFIGSTNINMDEHDFGDLTLGFDAQFYPATTTTGNQFLEADIKDFSLEFTDKPFRSLPGHTELVPLSSGTLNDEDASLVLNTSLTSPQQSLYDLNVLTASDGGSSKFSLLKPAYNVKDGQVQTFSFSDSQIPLSWSVWDMAGATNASSWTSVSGIVKQTGSIYGHGDSTLSTEDLFNGPFGTHLVTDISCDRTDTDPDNMVGNAIVARVKTSNTGFLGIGFNVNYGTSGTEATSSGYYVALDTQGVRLGKFDSITNTSPLSYQASYEVLDSVVGTEYSKTGTYRDIGVYFTAIGTVDLYIDGTQVFTLTDTLPGLRSGYFSVISNGNDYSEVYDVHVYRREFLNKQEEVNKYSTEYGAAQHQVLYGSQDKCLSVRADVNLVRSTGLAVVGTCESSPEFTWKSLDSVPTVFTDYVQSTMPIMTYIPDQKALVGLFIHNRKRGMLSYDLDTNRWVVAKDIPETAIATTDYNDLQFDPYSLNTYVAISFKSEKPYEKFYSICGYSTIVYATCVDLSDGSIDLWGSDATYSATKFAVKNIAARIDGYSDWRGSSVNGDYLANFGFPTFCWSQGCIIMPFYVGSGFHYTNLLPDKNNAWMYGTTGGFSYSEGKDHYPVNDEPAAHEYVYVEEKDAIYLFIGGQVLALDMKSRAWSTKAECPVSFSSTSTGYTHSIKAIYVSCLSRIFIKVYNRQHIYIYNVVTDTWEDKVRAPVTLPTRITDMTYVSDKHKIYVSPGTNSFDFYELSLPPGRSFIDYSPTVEEVLPENSFDGAFLWNGPDSFIKDEAFDYTSLDRRFWATTASGTSQFPVANPAAGCYTGYGAPDATRVSYKSYGFCRYTALAGVGSRIPTRAASFEATIDMRITEDEYSSGTDRFFGFGVGEGRINAASVGNYLEPVSYNHNRGYNGLYMCSINNSTYPGRYTLAKDDGSSTSTVAASSYIDFYGDEGTWDSTFKEWKISYDAVAQTLVAKIDDTTIGSITLNSPMPEMFLEIGTNGFGANVFHTCEFKNFAIDFNNGQTIRELDSSKKLKINKNVAENGDHYYERISSDISEDVDFVYEAKVRIDDASTTNTPYLATIGRVRNGEKEIHLCAISDAGVRKVGFWTGQDPWTAADGYDSLYSIDWRTEATYRIVRDSTLVSLYIDDFDTPVVTKAYSDFPACRKWNWRTLAFGCIDIAADQVTVVDGSIDEYPDGPVEKSGSWSRKGHDTSNPVNLRSWYGSYYRATAAVGDYSTNLRYDLSTPVVSGTKYIYSSTNESSTSATRETPLTIYHGGVIDTPTPDSFATNNIVSVSLDTTYSGTSQVGSTMIKVDDERRNTGDMNTGTDIGPMYQGKCYLGAYSNPEHLYITVDDSTGTQVYSPTVFVHDFDPNEKMRSKCTSYWTHVRFYPNTTVPVISDVAGFSIVNTGSHKLLDAYSSDTDPALTGSNITSSEVF